MRSSPENLLADSCLGWKGEAAPRNLFITPRLPASMPPLADEVFASWIIRLAEAHGQEPRSLCDFLCGRSSAYNADFSGVSGDRLLDALGAATRLGAEYIRSESTLAGLEGRLFVRNGNSTKLPWVLRQGSHGGWRPAMQFCPWCLDDASPYFRRNWRLSLFTVCTDHFLGLRHICPACEAPVDPVRSAMRFRRGIQPFCWKCGFDLRRTPVRLTDQVDADMAYENFKALMYGAADARWPVGVSLPEYFAVLSLLCTRLFIPAPRLQSWREDTAKAAGTNLPTLARRAVTMFDALADPDLRRPFVRTATWLLEEWPTRFLAQAQAAHTRTSDFVPRCVRVPKWFLETLETHLTLPKPAPAPNLPRDSDLSEILFEPMVKQP